MKAIIKILCALIFISVIVSSCKNPAYGEYVKNNWNKITLENDLNNFRNVVDYGFKS